MNAGKPAEKIVQGQDPQLSTEMYRRALDLLDLGSDLDLAIARQEFVVYYQPVVSLFTGRIEGLEALVRWYHPRHGTISPAVFVPMAEDTGAIADIDRWVLREACHQLGVWKLQGLVNEPFSISVNLSASELVQPDLLDHIDCILEEAGLQGHHLKLEIAEKAIASNTPTAESLFENLQSRQIHLGIDDFGNCYSSLNDILLDTFDTLKFDRSFVRNMGLPDENPEIAHTIEAVLDTPRLEVVAKGVETQQQLSRLRSLHCEYGQGYFFSRPVDGRLAGNLFLSVVH